MTRRRHRTFDLDRLDDRIADLQDDDSPTITIARYLVDHNGQPVGKTFDVHVAPDGTRRRRWFDPATGEEVAFEQARARRREALDRRLAEEEGGDADENADEDEAADESEEP